MADSDDLKRRDGSTVMPSVVQIRHWASELGFRHAGIVDVSDFDRTDELAAWLARQFHGDMHYMARNQDKRARPTQLLPGTTRAIVVGMDYAPAQHNWIDQDWQRINSSAIGYVSHYARGRDYHKRVRNQLQKLADIVTDHAGPHGYRAFCDSAPVMEVALAQRAGLGWRGKHTLMLNREQGSVFFLGTLFTDLPLEPSDPGDAHCGSCQQCIDVCPTQAIVAPYQLDARRCISYLTIEHQGSIDPALRPLIGNRVYGCDDCQLVCPWNKFAQPAQCDDFAPRHGLENSDLTDLMRWTEAQFDQRTLGSAIRRIGYQQWSRNIAIGLGNIDRAAVEPRVVDAAIAVLLARRSDASELLAEHIDWALVRLRSGAGVSE